MVDFHGSTIPRGWQREFPNLIGMEAVAGPSSTSSAKTTPARRRG